jgi:hypothetical protein
VTIGLLVFFGGTCIFGKLMEAEYLARVHSPREERIQRSIIVGRDKSDRVRNSKIRSPFWGLIIARREDGKVILECKTPGFSYTVVDDTPEPVNTYAIGGAR